MIRTENLTKIYSSGTKAVDNLDVHVKEGEIFGFLGPNGAGKSTTIKILTTLARPTSGFAWVGGYNVFTEQVKVRCSIGYVAQETGVDYFLSGRENLVLQGRLYRMDGKSISRRVDELLELFDIKDSADQLVSTYSGGMRRKLDIATALIHNPRLMFLDEPTIGLDPHSRSTLWNYIRMLNKDLNVTIFLTTHYLDEADKLSHRIGILHKGNMKIVDTPEALKDSIKGDSVNLSLNGKSKDKALSILRDDSMVKELLCEDEHVRVYVNNGSEAIPGLMKLLNQHGVEVSSLTISRPSLDDVYLKYTGVSFKEGESSEGANPWWAQWQKKGWGKNWKGGGDSEEEGSKEWEEGNKEQQGGEEQWKQWAQGDNEEWTGADKEWTAEDKEQQVGAEQWKELAQEDGKELTREEKEWKAEDKQQGGEEQWKQWSQGGNKEWTGEEKEWKEDKQWVSEDKEWEDAHAHNPGAGSEVAEKKDQEILQSTERGDEEPGQSEGENITVDDWDKKKEDEPDEDHNDKEPWKKWSGDAEASEWSKWGNKKG